MGMASTKTGDEVVWPQHSPERRQFSVLCYRGWCDNVFRDRDIAAMITAVTGTPWPTPENLPARECPTPDICQCECHDPETSVTIPVLDAVREQAP